MATYSLPSLYEVVKPEQYYHTTFQNTNNSSTTTGSSSSSSSSSAFHRVGSPPELLHDSEEDDGDSFSSTSTTPQHDLLFDEHTYHSRRKSVPHKSPSILQDVFQASAIDKSVIFQWDTTTLLPPIQQQHDNSNNDTSSATIIKPKVICGESLLSALRHRVALARQQDLPIKKRIIHMPRRQLTATCIELPNHHQQGITKHKLSIPIIHQHTSLSSSSSHHHSMKINNNISINSLIDPLPKSSSSFNQIDPISNSSPSSPIAPIIKQRGRKPLQPSSSTTTTRHTSSGRPSRVKGPCQACQETSDGCMRKAFDWPFPTNQTFNDKGKPFVYLCNKCGLRFNKSGGCVCRHCRWVFCKEEKRKAMQYIEQMRRNRPDGYIDPEEEIENFVCTPKYWSCGQRWKVGWVLNSTTSTTATHSSDDDEDIDTISSSSPSYPTSPSL
ncbi:hypothetical protein BJ944DRAFT_244531 [Cunninghamella echinulata]|nr:hypothetical protein BJ944DRAFT_244531 [Cunninghamella echinulata]